MSKTQPEFRTAPYDPRFPNTNQSKHCYLKFLEYQRCKKKNGEDFGDCQYLKKISSIICPNDWINKWNEQIADGVFPGRI